MPVIATERKNISELIKGRDDYGVDNALNDNFQEITVTGTATIPNIGVPVIWVEASGAFEVYVDQVVATAKSANTTNPLGRGYVLAVTAGNAVGLGKDPEDVNLTAGDANFTGAVTGKMTFSEQGLHAVTWDAVSAPNQVLYKEELLVQGITFVDNATVVNPSYT